MQIAHVVRDESCRQGKKRDPSSLRSVGMTTKSNTYSAGKHRGECTGTATARARAMATAEGTAQDRHAAAWALRSR